VKRPPKPIPLRRFTKRDFESRGGEPAGVVGGVEVPLKASRTLKTFAPENFRPESTTVWSFPDRGDWATHAGNYRGNWSPYIPRNLILRYTKPGEVVLDPMLGGGTTLVECKLLGRNGIGVDINRDALLVAFDRLNFLYRPLDEDYVKPSIDLFHGDARHLDLIKDGAVDLVATHPPYAGIIKYTDERVEEDLSRLQFPAFLEAMRQVAAEAYRVLKPGKHCAILIGDTRQHKHYVPISARVLQQFLDAGFLLREDIVKVQHKMKSTREQWSGSNHDFYLIYHEHLFVFRKPAEGEKGSDYRNSAKWW
jgi:DNA modification methylase